MMISEQDASQLQRALFNSNETYEPLSLDLLQSDIISDEHFIAKQTQEKQQVGDDEEWVRSFLQHEILDDNDEDASITQEFFLPDDDEHSFSSFAEVAEDENFCDYDNETVTCDAVHSHPTTKMPYFVPSQYQQPQATIELMSEAEFNENNDSMNSLSEAFEQLNRSMERTARTREMIRQAGLSSSSHHSSHSTHSEPVVSKPDLDGSFSSHGSRTKRRCRAGIKKSGSATSLKRSASSSEMIARTGVAPRRMLKGGANALFAPASPLPVNNHLRVSLSVRKRMMRDLKAKKNAVGLF